MNTIDSEIPELVTEIQPKRSEITPRDGHIEPDECDSILNLLSTIEYGSRNHVIMRLLWTTGIRRGTLRTIDVDDVDFDSQSIKISHQPDSDTPLKNGKHGERRLSIDSETMSVIEMYMNHRRDDVTDDYDRDPLITTTHGRASTETISLTVAQQTRPCLIDGSCPHGYEQSDCEYWGDKWKAKQCPSSHTPHKIRRGAITHHLNEVIPLLIVSDKINVSKDILKEHYDARSEREKMELRKEHTDSLFSSMSDDSMSKLCDMYSGP